MGTLFTCSLYWKNRREQVPFDTSRSAYTNSVPDQQSLYRDRHSTLAYYNKCRPPVGHVPVVKRKRPLVNTLEKGTITPGG